ncbi:MAG TPA: CoA ester lyase [Pseudonocardia sp.]|nr:CoA ester lyase [Pseudonocardia sp.]
MITVAGARSWLFTPGDRADRFGGGAVHGADVTLLDLEDAVAPEQKALARATVAGYLAGTGVAWVRVNGTDTAEWADDLTALAATPTGLAGVVLPKTETPDQLAATAARLPAGTPVLALVETALGVQRAAELAAAPATARLAFGSVDFCRDTGIPGASTALLYARSQLVIASAAAGRPGPVDGPTVALDDLELLETDLAHAASLGFTGRFCLHPRQVAPTNRAFSPTEAQLAWARRVVAVAGDSGGAAVRVHGEMIDRPRLAAARQILDRGRLYREEAQS